MAYTEARRRAAHKHYQNHHQSWIDYQREYRRRLRLRAIELYGGKCVCCGETRRQFLAFDHISDDGYQDRHRKKRGSGWLNYLIKDHPNDIQLLCHNCNTAKAYYGQCPHQESNEAIYFDSTKQVGKRIFLGE